MSERAEVGETTRRTAVNVVVRAFAEVLGKIATLAWTVVVARVVSQDDFGAISYALAVMLIVSALPQWGFDENVVRRGAADPRDLPRAYAAATVWKTAVAVPIFALTAVALSFTRPTTESWICVLLFLLAGFPELWSKTARSVSVALERPASTSAALVGQRIVTAVGVLLGALLGYGIVGVGAGFLAGTVLGWLAHVVAVRRLGVRSDFGSLDRSDLHVAARQTAMLGLSALVLMLLFRLDAVLLEVFKGDGAVGVYSVAYRLLETTLFVAFAINQAIFPVVSRSPEKWKWSYAFRHAMAIGGFVYLPFIAVAVFEGQGLIDLLFGAKYAERGAEILFWLAPAALFYAVAFFCNALLVAAYDGRALFISSVAATVTNVALNLALIPPFGGVGAGVATVIAYVVQAGVSVYALRRAGVELPLVRPLIVPAAASVALVGVLWALSLPVLAELLVGGPVYVVVWAVLARFFAPEQLDVVRSLLTRREPPGVSSATP
ncbi:flippase [Nocardioidaceae bacterium]|nr:flippase [Nocardioidaceae bacterium]